MLLFKHAPEELAERLNKAFAGSTGVDLTQGSIFGNSNFQLSCCGLSVTASIKKAGVDCANYKHIFCNIDESLVGSSVAIGLGKHLEGGEKSAAIVQALLRTGKIIGELGEADWVVWEPGRTITGFEYFAQSTSDYDDGGAFPVIALVNFQSTDSGEIRSTGLDWLSGQELRVAPTDLSKTEIMRRIVRVAHDVATNGPFLQDTELAGLEQLERIELRPAGSILNVRLVSSQ